VLSTLPSSQCGGGSGGGRCHTRPKVLFLTFFKENMSSPIPFGITLASKKRNNTNKKEPKQTSFFGTAKNSRKENNVCISSIQPDGVQGTPSCSFHPGDVVLRVNNRTMGDHHHMEHQEVARLLKNATGYITLKVRRRESDDGEEGKNRCRRTHDDHRDSNNDERSNGDNNNNNNTTAAWQEEEEEWGELLCGGEGNNEKRSNSNIIQATIIKPPSTTTTTGNNNNNNNNNNNQNQNQTTMGLTLRENKENGDIYVSKIHPLSLFKPSITVGNIIVAVNHIPCENLAPTTVANIMQNAPSGIVTILVQQGVKLPFQKKQQNKQQEFNFQ